MFARITLKTWTRIGQALAGLAFLAVLIALLWPSPIPPVYWREPLPPSLAPNTALSDARILTDGVIDGTEDLVATPDGRLYLSSYQGFLQSLTPDPETGELVWSRDVFVSDEFLFGMQWMRDGRIAMAGVHALYAVDPVAGEAEVLSTGSITRPFGFVNDLDVAPDGTIYFSDTTIRWDVPGDFNFQAREMLEYRPHGFVYAWDPATRATRVFAERLYYPNGVSVSSDGQELFIAESTRYAIRRVQLEGQESGEIDYLIENLPGIPDGIMSDRMGRLFIALGAERSDWVRFLRRTSWLSSLLVKLGYNPALTPQSSRVSVLVVDERTGEILDSFQDHADSIQSLANVIPSGDGRMWLVGDGGSFVAEYDLPESYARPLSETPSAP